MKRTIKLRESDLKRMIAESVRRMLKESAIPQYENPVFIECDSEEDADVCVELGYSSYSSSRFYVGGCGTDAYAALAVVVQWLEENGLIDHYAYDEEDLDAYHPDDIIEVEGYYFPSWQIHIEQIVGNHGERPGSLGEAIRRNVKRVLREWADGADSIEAYHVATIGADDSDQEEADFAYEIYDAITHNEMTADEAIQEITNGDLSADGDVEIVPSSAHNFGYSKDGQYFLTYDPYTGTFDVWEAA